MQQSINVGPLTIVFGPTLSVSGTGIIPAGIQGQPYSLDLNSVFTVTGGLPPYTFSVAPGGTLPPGWSLTPTGILAVASGPGSSVSIPPIKISDSGSVP